ncbi:MAG: PD40 domain-containing protein, partial [Acidobacteria bacterium]|nr:PD40 domain-containing protein [Acidobacteriota bacterium]
RDFKPGNVLLVDDPGYPRGVRAVVTDFGLAAHGGVTFDARLTGSGLVVGTANYMAPEQAEGKEVGVAADIYALGVVMYEMVTGVLPHTGESAVSMLWKRLNDPPPTPKRDFPGVSTLWEGAILRCLERDPVARFRQADEVARVLAGDETLLARHAEPSAPTVELPALGVPAIAAPAPAPPPSAAPSSASRAAIVPSPKLKAGLGAAGVALLAVITLIGVRSARSPEQPAPAPAPAGPRAPEAANQPVLSVQVTASAGLDLHPSFAPDGRSLAYASDRTGAFEIYVKPLTPGGRELPITNDGLQNLEPVVSPDGQWIAYSSKGRGGVWIVPSLGGASRQLSTFGSHPTFSPDGRQVAFQSQPLLDLSPSAVPALPPSTIFVVDAAGGEPVAVTRRGTPEGGHGSPVFLPRGGRLAFTSSDSRNVRIFTVKADGSDLQPLVSDQPACRDPVFSPDGGTMYFCASPDRSNFGIVALAIDPVSGKPKGRIRTITTQSLGRLRYLSLSSDGTKMLYSAMAVSSNLQAVSLDAAGRPRGEPRSLTNETGRNTRPVYSPDGSRIAFSRFRPGGNEDIWIIERDGSGETQLTTSPAVDTRPSWFPNGRSLVFFSNRDGKRALWQIDLATGRETRLFEPGADADSARLSPDGKELVFNRSKDGAINVWRAPLQTMDGGVSGLALATQVTDEPELAGWACYSRDGERLALQVKRGDDIQVALTSADPRAGPGRLTLLTKKPGLAWPSSFSPSGDRVLFAGQRDGVWNVFWVSTTAPGREEALTFWKKMSGYVRYPDWSPKGDEVVYELAETRGNVWMAEQVK